MTASYISSWSTAALTIERYLAIAHPLSHMKYGHVDRAKVMLYWVPIPFILQLFQFFSLEPSNTEERKCALKEANYQIIAQAVDTVLCYVVPCGIIVVLNILVALQVRKSQEHFMEGTKKSNSRRTGGSSSASGTWTRILWVMPLVFVVLNTPFYVIMMIEIIFQIIYQSPPSFDTRTELFMVCSLTFDVFRDTSCFRPSTTQLITCITWTPPSMCLSTRFRGKKPGIRRK